MLTCDKTVHYRNIKLGLPSCLTGSHTELPYASSTKTGRIFLPLTDPKEKLKSLLEMEFTLVLKNNTTIKQRLIRANIDKELVYYKKSRSGPRETRITNKIPNGNMTELIDFIDGLNLVAEQIKGAFLQEIEILPEGNDEQYSSLRNRIITDFRNYFCPPFVIPIPSIPNPDDALGPPVKKKG